MYACMVMYVWLCMHVCLCMYVCMYVCMYGYIYMYAVYHSKKLWARTHDLDKFPIVDLSFYVCMVMYASIEYMYLMLTSAHYLGSSWM